jgi:hypothetical protein
LIARAIEPQREVRPRRANLDVDRRDRPRHIAAPPTSMARDDAGARRTTPTRATTAKGDAEGRARARDGSKSGVTTPSRVDEDDFCGDDGATEARRAREDEDEDAREGADRRRDDFARDFLARSGCVGEARRRAATPPATLRLEYWTRDETTTEAKRAHIDRLDDELGYYGVEEHIERTVLKGKPVAIETNMFPYETPRGVTHMTLWSREEMDGEAIVDWTCAWLRENKPNVTEWNFDLNENHSVDVPHYHVFTYEPSETAPKTNAKKRKLNASASDLSAI